MCENGASNISFSCHWFPARSAQSEPIYYGLSTIIEHTYGHECESVSQTGQRKLSASEKKTVSLIWHCSLLISSVHRIVRLREVKT